MNYIKQINAFNRRQEDRELSSQATTSYIKLLDWCNGLEWPESFSVRNELFRPKTKLSPKEFQRARAELVEKGFIKFTYKKCANKNDGGVYKLVQLYKDEPAELILNQNEGQYKPHIVPQTEKKSDTYKNNNTSCKQRERESAASLESLSLFQSKIKNAFPWMDVSFNLIPTDINSDLLIEEINKSPQFLSEHNPQCDLRFCIKHYQKIIKGHYRHPSYFASARAGPSPPAAEPRPLPNETRQEYEARIKAIKNAGEETL